MSTKWSYPGEFAKTIPKKPAVIMAATGDQLTYEDLDRRSNQLAHYFFDAGLRKGDHIALFAENHMNYMVVYWAAMRSGLYLTPINRYLRAEEAGYILQNCGAKVLLTSSKLQEVAVP